MTTTSTGNGAWQAVVGSLTISDDVVINHAVTLDGVVNMTGTLTINASKTLNTTGSNHNLTVSSSMELNGTLTCNASVVSSASVTGTGTMACDTATITCSDNFNPQTITMDAASIDVVDRFGLASTSSGSAVVSGTSAATIACKRFIKTAFTPGHSTVTMDGTGVTNHIGLGSGTFYNLIINSTGTKSLASPITVTNNLTITDGILTTLEDTTHHALTVTKVTTVSSAGTLILNSSDCGFKEGASDSSWGLHGTDGHIDFGSATVNIGGFYLSTDTTCSGVAATINIDGFHTTGEVLNWQSGTYDFGAGTTIEASGDTTLIRPHTSTINCKEFIASNNYKAYTENSNGETFTVNGDVTIKDSSSWYTSYRNAQYTNTLICTGTLNIEDNSEYYSVTQGDGNIMVVAQAPDDSYGSIKVDATSTYEGSFGTTTITGILKPSDIAGTFTLNGASWVFGGTGGLFEGDLLKNEREVRINQDKVLNFDGSSDFITVGDYGDLDIIGDLTLSAWVNLTLGEGNFQTIIGKGSTSSCNNITSPWQMRIDSNDKLEAVVGNGTNSQRVASTSTIDGQSSGGGARNSGWHHIALTFQPGTPSASETRVKYYINGVLDNTQDFSYIFYANSNDVLLGRFAACTYSFKGKMADVRIYNSLMTNDIPKMASKMNVDIGSPVAWWKLNEETANGGGAGTGYVQDSAIVNHQGTLTGTDWTYNDFGVDIQDNTTTVSNLIVESGQLNTKALDYLALDGGNDRVVVADAAGLSFGDGSDDDPFSLSAWIRMNDASNFRIISKNDASSNMEWKFTCAGDDLLYFYLRDQSAGGYIGRKTAALTTYENTWIHVTGTYDASEASAGIKIYVNGVQADTGDHAGGSYTAMESLDADVEIGKWSTNYANGKIRDVRIYDYKLSGDQVASLYRGSYNVTPKFGWKFDDGSGNATGFGTANAGGAFTGVVSGTSGTAISGFNEGSLKVNGAARVMTNGSVL